MTEATKIAARDEPLRFRVGTVNKEIVRSAEAERRYLSEGEKERPVVGRLEGDKHKKKQCPANKFDNNTMCWHTIQSQHINLLMTFLFLCHNFQSICFTDKYSSIS